VKTMLLFFLSSAICFGLGSHFVQWQACVRGYGRRNPITGRFQWRDGDGWGPEQRWIG